MNAASFRQSVSKYATTLWEASRASAAMGIVCQAMEGLAKASRLRSRLK